MPKRPDIKYDLGEEVYLKSDPNQLPRVITRIQLSGIGLIYLMQHADHGETAHYDYEITKEPIWNTKDGL